MAFRLGSIAALAGAAILGCGSADRAGDAEAVVERFQAALAQGDGRGACSELSAETSRKLEQQEGEPCEEAVLGLRLPTGDDVSPPSVHITSAFAAVGGGAAIFLDEGPDGWMVSAAGCRRTASDMPYDCDLEG